MINVSELIKDSYNILRKEKLIYIIAVVITILSLLSNWSTKFINSPLVNINLGLLSVLLFKLVVGVIMVYLTVMSLAVISMGILRKLKNKSMILRQTNHFLGRYLGLGLLIWLISVVVLGLVMVIALILGWLMIMIIPVITTNIVYWLVIFSVIVIPMFLFLYLKFYLATPIMFLEDKKVIDSLKDSYSKSKGHVIDILLIGMILLIMAVVWLASVSGINFLSSIDQYNAVITSLSLVVILVISPVFIAFAQILYFNGYLAIKNSK